MISLFFGFKQLHDEFFSVLETLETVAEEDDVGSGGNEEDDTKSNELCMESFEDYTFDLSNQKSKYEC